MKEYKKIEIEWLDITFFKGTYEESDLKNLQEQHIKTIGYLIKEEKDYIIISFGVEITEPFRVLDLYKIPKFNIIKRQELKEGLRE